MKKKVFSLFAMVAVLSLIIALAGCGQKKSDQAGTTATEKLDTVKVAFDDSVGESGVILGDELGFFKSQGIKIEYVKFNSGVDELTALASGQVDISRGIIAANLFNAAARGIDLKLVADGGTNIPGRGYFRLCIKKSLADKVKDYKDLKGLKVGVASTGSINELLLELALAKAGMTSKDVQVVTVDSFPDLNTAITNGTVDAIMQLDPLVTKGVEQGILDPWKDPSDYAPGEEISVVMYSPQFAGKKDLANKFMVGYLQGVRAYNDALITGNKDQDKVIDILTKKTFVNDPNLFKKMSPPGLDPNGAIPKDGVIHDQQWYMDKGLVKTATDINKLIDTSYVNYAVEKLGQYSPAK